MAFSRAIRLVGFLVVVISIRSTFGVPRTHLRSINADPLFTKWPNSTIPYYIDSVYTSKQAQLIRSAAQKVSTDMSGCIKFVEVKPTSAQYKIKVTPFKTGTSVKELRCSAYPGIFTGFQQAGYKEQRIVLVEGEQGCLDGTLHPIMKYFTIILGKINEHQRSDRDDFIKINETNLVDNSQNIYRQHDLTDTFSTCSYDYCSITHNPETMYTPDGSKVGFTVLKAPFYIPKLTRLSECDCKDLSILYECESSKCEPLNCAGLVKTAGDKKLPEGH
ncbi:hypothetical protein RvY_15516 [Ramazzottius varieornatus]|uniref:Metalloendopeptidase n=1 Tax=Ramazzottius varieornatus TaxID=947166 RepID=A0A1D1W362_RAMVA|nr:hypothetical protein RvY_15516 [Ramazzottius varieornatus]